MRRFALGLLLLLAPLLIFENVALEGDVAEYSLVTVALASHESPDIRLQDIARARELAPELAGPYELLEKGMREGDDHLYAAFIRGRTGDVYAVHFFAYPLLAAVPYKLFEAAGVHPFRTFLAVNLAAVFVLGLALRRMFGNNVRAFIALVLFMLCGGALYVSWTSPEFVSAALLLAALTLYTSGARLAGAICAGIASLQNPTIVFFFGAAPLLQLLLQYEHHLSFTANVKRVLAIRHLAALVAGVAVFACAPLFNVWQFGVPNIIAKLFADGSMIGTTRLYSFFFDLNQGMLIGIPALVAALACWGWKSSCLGWRSEAGILIACSSLTLALAIPALSIYNWNSSAAGIMRYAFWSAMPLLFALLLRLKHHAQWPRATLAAFIVVQAGAMLHASSYHFLEYSPLARNVMQYAPGLYHPEPEIFAERMSGRDDYVNPSQIYSREANGSRVTTLYNRQRGSSEAALCGEGRTVSRKSLLTDLDRGWRYVDGPIHCEVNTAYRSFRIDQFKTGIGISLGEGWSQPESNGSGWDGVWSDGRLSEITVSKGPAPETLTFAGHYFSGNTRTRVTVNGVDLGWHQLAQTATLTLPEKARNGIIRIELEHDAPRTATEDDRRQLALFLTELTLR